MPDSERNRFLRPADSDSFGSSDPPQPLPVGGTMSLSDYWAAANNPYGLNIGGRPEHFYETKGMSPEDFLRSPYSQYVLQPDGMVRYRGTGEGWVNPTWIDQGGAGNAGFGYHLKAVAPYALAVLGAGAALGGLGGLAGAAGASGAGGSSFIPGVLDYAPSVLGGGAELGAGTYLGGGAAALGETINYMPGVWDTVPTAFGGDAAAAGMGFKMPFPTSAPTWPGSSDGNPPVPGSMTDPAWQNIPWGAVGAGGGLLGNLLGGNGLTSSPQAQTELMKQIGNLLSTGLGAYASNQQANAMKDIAAQAQNARQPFLDDALDMLKNPDKFYQRPEVMGAVDASLRGLSSKVGNPINNPGALAQQAAYNTNLYNNTLNSRAALGLGNQDVISKLQTNAAIANTGPLRQIGSGLGSLFGQNYGDVLGSLYGAMY